MRPSNECVEVYAEQCESMFCTRHNARAAEAAANVDLHLKDGWHACRNGSGFRVWHKGRSYAHMTEAEAMELDLRADSEPTESGANPSARSRPIGALSGGSAQPS